MNAVPAVLEVDPGSVYSFDLLRGEVHVREWPDAMPASGTLVAFAGRQWIVTRRHVLTAGGRACFVACLMAEVA